MRKPIIGIIGKVQPQYEEDIWHRIDEVDEIRYLIVRNGGTAIMLLPTEETLKFNDNDRKVVNLDYITQIEYDPFVIGGEDSNRYIKFYFLGRTSCILEYSDLDKYYKDKEYLDKNLIVNV